MMIGKTIVTKAVTETEIEEETTVVVAEAGVAVEEVFLSFGRNNGQDTIFGVLFLFSWYLSFCFKGFTVCFFCCSGFRLFVCDYIYLISVTNIAIAPICTVTYFTKHVSSH